MTLEEKRIKKFLKLREKYILNLLDGLLNKKEFLEKNYLLIFRLAMRPFLKIDSIEKCIYNYQYYNVLAKYYKKKSKTSTGRISKEYDNKAKNYYIEKDKVTNIFIQLVDCEDIKAYYLIMESSRLDKKLIEIVFKKMNYVVLHTLDRDIIDNLLEREVLEDRPRISYIDHYVNCNYD